MKRLIDMIFSAAGLILAGPLLIPVLLLVWIQDFHSPFYIAPRVGKNFRLFPMIKLRSMIVRADRSGVDSTSSSDRRITPVGHFIRSYKLDELSQLWNVMIGHMSLVGPRPNVERETKLYTNEERKLLSVRPGITDFASIVFSDEGRILEGCPDPDLAYNQLIRPWKSRLGIFYIEHQSLELDMKLIALTVTAIVSRDRALRGVSKLLEALKADPLLIQVSKRQQPLEPYAPPGADSIVTDRKTPAFQGTIHGT